MKYFAYGSNMDQDQMRERCPESKLIGPAALENYALAFNIFSPKRQCGCADVIYAPGGKVWGLLYEITENDLKNLDEAEAHPYKYKRSEVSVVDMSGAEHHAEVYMVVNKEKDFIKPSRHYLGLMQSAAKKFDFPEEYKIVLSKISTID